MSVNIVIFLFLCPIILNCKNYLIEVQDDIETTTGIPKNKIETTYNEKLSASGSDYFFDFASFFRRHRKKIKKGKIQSRMLWRHR